MARRILSRITPSGVIATIALFAALGGGYAVAFSGSGSLQKGAKLGGWPSDGSVVEVRSLTGIGGLGFSCLQAGGAEMDVSLRNNSGETLSFRGTAGAAQFSGYNQSSNNNYLSTTHLTAGAHVLRLHIAPVNGTKAPQADLIVTYNATGTCATSFVSVLALNTQQ